MRTSVYSHACTLADLFAFFRSPQSGVTPGNSPREIMYLVILYPPELIYLGKPQKTGSTTINRVVTYTVNQNMGNKNRQ